MEFVFVTIVACVAFAFCFAVFMLKGRKEGKTPRLHTCGQDHDCRCHGKNAPAQREKCPHDMQTPEA
jgi:hypothetical protein